MIILLLSCSANQTIDQTMDGDTHLWEIPYCEEALEALTELEFGESPSLGNRVHKKLRLANPCEGKVVLMGDPTFWVSGDGFNLDDLPPVLIEAEDEIDVDLVFQPEQQGNYEGTLEIPFDGSSSPLFIELHATVSAPRTLVLVGDGKHTATTSDYGNSIVEEIATQEPNTNQIQRGICWGNGRFLAVGGTDQRSFWTSYDGYSWQGGFEEGSGLRDCAYGNDTFVAFDSESPLYSIAGMEWNEGEPTPWMNDTLRAIEFGGGIFIAVGDQGRIARTTSGEGWDLDISLGNFNLHAIAYGNEKFIAVGTYGAVLTSDNLGEGWSEQRVGNTSLQRAMFVNERFLISDGSRIYSSTDGEIWTVVNEQGVKPIAAMGTIIFGLKEQALFASRNNGESFEMLNNFSYSSPFFDATLAGDQ